MSGDDSQGSIYQIRVRGHLDSEWSEWFGELSLSLQKDGTTLLEGPIADQPALHGVLVRIRDLGLPLVSVHRTGSDSQDDT